MCGDNPLALRLVEALAERKEVQVTVVLRSHKLNQGPAIAAVGVRVIEAPKPDTKALLSAGIAEADALALVDQNDAGNIHTALRAHELNPDLRMVVRLFNTSLGKRIQQAFPDVMTVLSDAETAAPLFVAAALGKVPANYTSLPGEPKRSIYVTNRSLVTAKRVVIGLADTTTTPGKQRLPEDESSADLVLALANGPIPVEAERARLVKARTITRLQLARLSAVLSTTLVSAALGLVALLGVGVLVLALIARRPWSDALYLIVLDAAGAANPDIGLSGLEKLIQSIVTLVGITFIPVVTAAVVNAIIKSRLATALGRPPPMRDHVVVIGLGNIGDRVIEQLHNMGIPVLGVENDPQARGVATARRLGVPVVIGDASREQTLRDAYVADCRVLLAVANNDLTNLEAALHGRAMQPELRVVLRLFDDDLAAKIEKTFTMTISRSVSFLAAPAFVAAMAGRQIMATIPLSRRVLLIAKIPVGTRATMIGMPVRAASAKHQFRVLALQRRGQENLELPAPAEYSLKEGDLLIVVATRTGLARLIHWSTTPPQPPPEPGGLTVR